MLPPKPYSARAIVLAMAEGQDMLAYARQINISPARIKWLLKTKKAKALTATLQKLKQLQARAQMSADITAALKNIGKIATQDRRPDVALKASLALIQLTLHIQNAPPGSVELDTPDSHARRIEAFRLLADNHLKTNADQ